MRRGERKIKTKKDEKRRGAKRVEKDLKWVEGIKQKKKKNTQLLEDSVTSTSSMASSITFSMSSTITSAITSPISSSFSQSHSITILHLLPPGPFWLYHSTFTFIQSGWKCSLRVWVGLGWVGTANHEFSPSLGKLLSPEEGTVHLFVRCTSILSSGHVSQSCLIFNFQSYYYITLYYNTIEENWGKFR